MSNKFFKDIKIIQRSMVTDFERDLKKYLVEDTWEPYSEVFPYNGTLCQVLVKHTDR